MNLWTFVCYQGVWYYDIKWWLIKVRTSQWIQHYIYYAFVLRNKRLTTRNFKDNFNIRWYLSTRCNRNIRKIDISYKKPEPITFNGKINLFNRQHTKIFVFFLFNLFKGLSRLVVYIFTYRTH